MSLTIKVNTASAMREIEIEAKEVIEKEMPKRKNELVEALRNATPIDTGKARAGWETTKSGIDNNVEYIDNLNNGTSKQAPPYFIERTLLSHRGVLPSGIIVRRK